MKSQFWPTIAMALSWGVCATVVLLQGEPIPAWFGALLCGMIAGQIVVSYVGERISNSTVRTAALTEALRAAGDMAERLGREGKPLEAIAILDACKAIGDLTERR